MEINRKEIVAAVVIILLAILFVRQNPQPVEPGSSYLTPQQVSLTGIYLCLPHRDTSGPQTMECALGMQTDDGAYYALDFNSAQIPSTLRAGDRF